MSPKKASMNAAYAKWAASWAVSGLTIGHWHPCLMTIGAAYVPSQSIDGMPAA